MYNDVDDEETRRLWRLVMRRKPSTRDHNDEDDDDDEKKRVESYPVEGEFVGEASKKQENSYYYWNGRKVIWILQKAKFARKKPMDLDIYGVWWSDVDWPFI